MTYMRYSLIPLCLMIIPFGFVAIQLALRYESRPFRPGETTVLTVLFKNAVPDFEKPVKLIVPDGLMVDSKPVRIESEKSVAWRLKTLKPGIYEVGVQVGNEQISKKIIVSDELHALSPVRFQAGFMQYLLSPAEPRIPSSSEISSVGVIYPKNRYGAAIVGLPLWLVLFFVFSLIFGFAFKGVFKVQI